MVNEQSCGRLAGVGLLICYESQSLNLGYDNQHVPSVNTTAWPFSILCTIFAATIAPQEVLLSGTSPSKCGGLTDSHAVERRQGLTKDYSVWQQMTEPGWNRIGGLSKSMSDSWRPQPMCSE